MVSNNILLGGMKVEKCICTYPVVVDGGGLMWTAERMMGNNRWR